MHRDPKARVLLAVARHADTFGERIGDGILVRATVAEIAAQVGVDPRLAEELMVRLRRLRLVQQTTEGIVVTALDRLQDFIGFLEKPQGTGSNS
jgi:hypothetical protein